MSEREDRSSASGVPGVKEYENGLVVEKIVSDNLDPVKVFDAYVVLRNPLSLVSLVYLDGLMGSLVGVKRIFEAVQAPERLVVRC